MLLILFFRLDIYQISPPLSHSEAVLNANLIWPCLKACVKLVMDHYNNSNINICFIPGEEHLHAMTKQLERIGSRHDDRYKADGIIKVNTLFDLEIMVLETSSRFGNRDRTKHSFDLHKAMFGLLAMLKTIADQFEYASIESFEQLKIYFVHVSGDVCHIWSLKYNANGSYLFCREDKAKLHQKFEEKDDHLLSLCNFFGNLKEKIVRCVDQLTILHHEHKEKKRLSRYQSNNNLCHLSATIKPSIICLTQQHDSR
ncbi:hypothetical protein BC941DRAFT_356201 [Chlamydoabsidia padenii]|nr:hypothetical protein BC941DRAFT_356201 [Chlamydoabsidia padenii]